MMRVLIEFPSRPEADRLERLSNYCLYPLRVACGSPLHEVTSKVHRVAEAIFALLLLPVTLIGLSLAYFSSSHRIAYLNSQKPKVVPKISLKKPAQIVEFKVSPRSRTTITMEEGLFAIASLAATSRCITKAYPSPPPTPEKKKKEESPLDLAKRCYKEAHTLFQAKEYQEALEAIEKVAKQYPKHYNVLTLRGDINFELGRYISAGHDYDAAIEVNSKGSFALLRRGDLFSFQQNYSKAINDYNQALGIDPNAKEVHLRRAGAYFHLKLYHEALKDFDHVLKSKPNDSYVLGRKAAVLFELGRTHEANALLLMAKKSPQGDPFFDDLINKFK